MSTLKSLFVIYTFGIPLFGEPPNLLKINISRMEIIKRTLGLIKSPTQLVDRMLFELRVMDGEEQTEKPRKVSNQMSLLFLRFYVVLPR